MCQMKYIINCDNIVVFVTLIIPHTYSVLPNQTNIDFPLLFSHPPTAAQYTTTITTADSIQLYTVDVNISTQDNHSDSVDI